VEKITTAKREVGNRDEGFVRFNEITQARQETMCRMSWSERYLTK